MQWKYTDSSNSNMPQKQTKKRTYRQHTSYLSPFLHRHNCWFIFFHAKVRNSRQNSVNCNKTNFAPEQRKLWQNWVVSTFLMWIDVDKFLHMTDFLHIYYVKRFLHITICQLGNISTKQSVKWRNCSTCLIFFSTGTACEKYEVC